MDFKQLPHDELKYVAYGKSLNEAIENACYALFDSMYHFKNVRDKRKFKFLVSGSTLEDLIWSTLSHILWFIDAKNFFINKVTISKIVINKGKEKEKISIEVEAKGDVADPRLAKREVKGISKNDFKVVYQKNWKIFFVLDV